MQNKLGMNLSRDSKASLWYGLFTFLFTFWCLSFLLLAVAARKGLVSRIIILSNIISLLSGNAKNGYKWMQIVNEYLLTLSFYIVFKCTKNIAIEILVRFGYFGQRFGSFLT